jgi:hypothetical protein
LSITITLNKEWIKKNSPLFLAQLKENKISNKKFGDFVGYNATTISLFLSGKKPIPKVLAEAIKGLQFKMQIGIDLSNIIKK